MDFGKSAMVMDVIENSQCLACGSIDLRLALDLGNQPLANSYTSEPVDQQSYPLAVNLCGHCFHLQLSHTVNPELIYKNYLYTTGTSQTMKNYSQWFAGFVLETFKNKPNSVLDIGCNDGTQLNYFSNLGLKTFGVDPAENLLSITDKKHNIYCEFFQPGIEEKINQQFDIVIAQNVFAHNPSPLDFLKTTAKLLTDNGILFIQTSQADMIVNREFDTIYHEHINFFNSMSMKAVCERAGLKLFDVIKTPVHGNSYVFCISKNLERPFNIDNIIDLEKKLGLFEEKTYKDWRQYVHSNTDELALSLDEFRNTGYKIVGYGAAAKGNTLLNFKKLSLDYIVDDNPLKQNLYTPGLNIPIRSPDYLSNETAEKIVFIPLAWNFFDEIRSKILSRRSNLNDKFIKYFPKVQCV